MNPIMMTKWANPTGRKKPTHCDQPGCVQATREGKPYCSDHVEQLSYVGQVQARIEARERELSDVAKRGARGVDVHGIVAREILCSLWIHGERSVARLARELNVEFEQLRLYIARLRKAKMISQTSPRRGAGEVTLAPELAALEDPRLVGLAPEAAAPGDAPAPLEALPEPSVAAQPLPLSALERVHGDQASQASCGGAG